MIKAKKSDRLEVGIPILSGVHTAKSAIQDVLDWANVDTIHVSINEPGGNEIEYKNLEKLDSRIKVTCQEKNLGLYGNFRFLVEECKEEFFIWHAFDDFIPRKTISQAFDYINVNREISLAIIPHKRQECFTDPTRWEGSATPGIVPDIKDRHSEFRSAIYADPSWIFGIWRSEYLQDIFPIHNFDWLDSYLLVKAISSHNVGIAPVSEEMIIGTWDWKSKIPHCVNGERFKSARYIIYSTGALLLRGYLFRYKEVDEYRKLIKYRVSQAKRLTNLLGEKPN